MRGNLDKRDLDGKALDRRLCRFSGKGSEGGVSGLDFETSPTPEQERREMHNITWRHL